MAVVVLARAETASANSAPEKLTRRVPPCGPRAAAGMERETPYRGAADPRGVISSDSTTTFPSKRPRARAAIAAATAPASTGR